MQVRIVGASKATRDLAFVDIPDQGAEIWGLNQIHVLFSETQLQEFTRWFQIHPLEAMVARQHLNYSRFGREHLAWLAQCKIPIYLERSTPDIPNSITYPYEEVRQTLGGNYFAVNSIGYMLALAIHLKATRISLFGVDMDRNDPETYARPAIEFLLGVAMGHGIKIVLPEESALLKGDLYGKTVLIPSGAFEVAMDSVRACANSLPYGIHRRSLTEVRDKLEEAYQTAIGGKALQENVHERLPTAAELRGMAPDFTGELKSEDYLRRLRSS